MAGGTPTPSGRLQVLGRQEGAHPVLRLHPRGRRRLARGGAAGPAGPPHPGPVRHRARPGLPRPPLPPAPPPHAHAAPCCQDCPHRLQTLALLTRTELACAVMDACPSEMSFPGSPGHPRGTPGGLLHVWRARCHLCLSTTASCCGMHGPQAAHRGSCGIVRLKGRETSAAAGASEAPGGRARPQLHGRDPR